MTATSPNKFVHTVQFAAGAALCYIVVGLLVYIFELHNGFNYISYIGYIVFVYLGLKSWSNKRGDLGLSYGQAMGYATINALVYTVFVSIWSIIFFKFIAPGFIEAQQELQFDKLEADGMPQAQLEQARKYAKMFSSLPVIISFSVFGGMFVLTLINLIVCAFVKRDVPTHSGPLGPHHFPPQSSDYSPLK